MTLTRNFAGDHIRASVLDGIGTMLIANEARKNAVTAAMWQAIPQAIHWLEADANARVVVVMGAGAQDFCAGADISEFGSVRADTASARLYEQHNSAAFAAIRTCKRPTIAAIRGICYGGGFGLAAACDLRIADHTARLCLPPARLGLAYPADAIRDIVQSLGLQQARKALFTATVMQADEALAAGFLLECVAAGALEAAAFTLAATVAGNAPLSIQAAKMAIRATLESDEDVLQEAALLGASTFDSADYAEGRAAFSERRTPNFLGK